MVKPISAPKKHTSDPDEILSTTQSLWLEISANPAKAAGIAGAVAGVILLVVLGIYVKERGAEKRLAALSSAVTAYLSEGSSELERSSAVTTFIELSRKGGSSIVSGQALLYLAGSFADGGNYDAAVEHYKKVLAAFSDNENLTLSASLGLAYVAKLSGRYSEAVEAFNKILTTEGMPLPRTELLYEIASLTERQGNVAEAATQYRSLTEEFPDTEWSKKALERLQILEGA